MLVYVSHVYMVRFAFGMTIHPLSHCRSLGRAAWAVTQVAIARGVAASPIFCLTWPILLKNKLWSKFLITICSNVLMTETCRTVVMFHSAIYLQPRGEPEQPLVLQLTLLPLLPFLDGFYTAFTNWWKATMWDVVMPQRYGHPINFLHFYFKAWDSSCSQVERQGSLVCSGVTSMDGTHYDWSVPQCLISPNSGYRCLQVSLLSSTDNTI